MKHKIFAFILAMTVASFAQTATQPAASAPTPGTENKAKCACCEKTASAKDGQSMCMRHGNGEAKDMASCCKGMEGASCCGKDAKSCMRGEKKGASCCKDGCDGKDKAACCERKAAKSCCKGCCGSSKNEKPA